MVTDQVSTGMAVAATVLGERPFHFKTAVGEWDGGPLTFDSPNQIVMQAPVKLQTENRLWLGEVVECRLHGDAWRTTIQVRHALNHLPALLNLAARFE